MHRFDYLCRLHSIDAGLEQHLEVGVELGQLGLVPAEVLYLEIWEDLLVEIVINNIIPD